jgi:hypothetical protein
MVQRYPGEQVKFELFKNSAKRFRSQYTKGSLFAKAAFFVDGYTVSLRTELILRD